MGSQPHDALFKATFSQPEHAAGLLRAVVPAAVAARIDWETLELVPGSFVDGRLAQSHSDLLFSAALDTGHPALLYVLVEHQSASDPWMALRLLGYVHRIWQRWRATRPDAERLPVVIPVVVHHDDRTWTGATSLGELLDVDADTRALLSPFLPELRFLLDDLSRVPTEALEVRPMSDIGRLALLCLQRARVSRDIVADLQRWIGMVGRVLAGPQGREAVAALLRYVLGVCDVEPDRVLAMLEEGLGSEGREAFMTGAQKLIERARSQAFAEGRVDVLLRLMTRRFGPVDAATAQRVRGAASTDVDRWTERILDATSVDELLAD